MIDFEAARAAIVKEALPLGPRQSPLAESLGCVLAEPIQAGHDVPLFDNSAMDGYGVRVTDVTEADENTPVRLALVGTIQAGDADRIDVAEGTAVKILTGAVVPPSVEAVVMREYAKEADGDVLLSRSAKPGENIRRKGEEFLVGQEVIAAGVGITPAVIGLLATFGVDRPKVFRRPAVTVIVTGNELIEPGVPLNSGQIYDSNSYALAAALEASGIRDVTTVRVSDDPDVIRGHLSEALEDSDVVVTVGGVSVGDYDFVKESLKSLDVEQIFWRVAMKPGKPNYFGTYRKRGQDGGTEADAKTLVFGVPGNPVAALLSFQLLVRPALDILRGAEPTPETRFEAVLETELRKKPGRHEFVRALAQPNADGWRVRPTVGQDSHMMGGLARANCLVHFPKDSERLDEGARVQAEFLPWR